MAPTPRPPLDDGRGLRAGVDCERFMRPGGRYTRSVLPRVTGSDAVRAARATGLPGRDADLFRPMVCALSEFAARARRWSVRRWSVRLMLAGQGLASLTLALAQAPAPALAQAQPGPTALVAPPATAGATSALTLVLKSPRRFASAGYHVALARGLFAEEGLGHRNFKRPRKARRPGRDPPGRDICGSKIVAAVPIRTASPLPPGLVWP